ncbi:nuclear transport factor 2 family protein [Sphaerisporangium corydalis]|uniref:Nuclear transport factor 2 family protein n=1 Tax=Sphaerisporangium corydalis TaxID=1441875 RepID=A0ABV9EM40_9ACTN|nr:nuclear transport factor 2 family protein [Sphaerisporangium corydalis]
MSTTDHVLDLAHRWAQAEEANDPELLGQVLAEDFVGVGPLGFVLNRKQWLARFGNGLTNSKFRIEDPQVHEHGPAAAVVVGVDAQETRFHGGENNGRFRLTLFAVRPADRWLVAGITIGPLRPRPGARPGEGD